MSYQCQLKEQPAQPALSIRTRTSAQELPQEMGQAYRALAEHLQEQGQEPAGPPFAAYYNMDMQDLDVEMGVPVPDAMPGQDQIQPSQIPGGKLATCIHTGPYEKIEAAYTALSIWVQEQGHRATGVAYERYLNDPSQTPPEALRTEIVFPLEDE
jgi:effector-binding domain-containing protein